VLTVLVLKRQAMKSNFYKGWHIGAEMDLVVCYAGKIFAIEMKGSSAPKLERGFRNALDDLKPDYAWVAAPVKEAFCITEHVDAAAPDYICQVLPEVYQS